MLARNLRNVTARVRIASRARGFATGTATRASAEQAPPFMMDIGVGLALGITARYPAFPAATVLIEHAYAAACGA